MSNADYTRFYVGFSVVWWCLVWWEFGFAILAATIVAWGLGVFTQHFAGKNL